MIILGCYVSFLGKETTMGKPTILYANHNSTAPLADGVYDAMAPFLSEEIGNPSEYNALGLRASQVIEEARLAVSRLFTCETSEVVFVSSGTESCFSAILGASSSVKFIETILISTVEHSAVRESAFFVGEITNIKIKHLPVSKEGKLNLPLLKEELASSRGILSVMLANNESGVIYPIKELTTLAHSYGWLVHTDAIGAAGKMEINFLELGVDYLSTSGHKFGAPKGVGVLIIRNGSPFRPVMKGGGQERGRRGGTEAVANIVGLGVAAQKTYELLNLGEEMRLRKIRDFFEQYLLQNVPDIRYTVKHKERLCNTSSICIPGLLATDLVSELGKRGIIISAGAACNSKDIEPSHVLRAMQVSTLDSLSTVRVSFGNESTQEQAKFLADIIAETTESLRRDTAALINERLQ